MSSMVSNTVQLCLPARFYNIRAGMIQARQKNMKRENDLCKSLTLIEPEFFPYFLILVCGESVNNRVIITTMPSVAEYKKSRP